VFYFVFELDFVSPKPALSNQAGRLPPFSVPTERVRILSLPCSTTGNCGSKTAPSLLSGGLLNVVKNPVPGLKKFGRYCSHLALWVVANAQKSWKNLTQ
jgi:hypothetical protein